MSEIGRGTGVAGVAGCGFSRAESTCLERREAGNGTGSTGCWILWCWGVFLGRRDVCLVLGRLRVVGWSLSGAECVAEAASERAR